MQARPRVRRRRSRASVPQAHRYRASSLGMLREEKCFATEILHEHGLRLATIREELANTSARDVAQKSKAEEIVELRQRIHELDVELRATKARSLTPTEVDIVSS